MFQSLEGTSPTKLWPSAPALQLCGYLGYVHNVYFHVLYGTTNLMILWSPGFGAPGQEGLPQISSVHCVLGNRPFSYSGKEPGSSVIFIHFYTRGSIEWR